MPQRLVEFQGQLHEFPEGASDEQVRQALQGMIPNAPESPMAPPIPPPQVDMQESLAGKVYGAGRRFAEAPLETTAPAMPAIGATIGGITGGIPGAVAGGALGKGGQQMVEARYGAEPIPSPLEATAGMALEGGVQGALEGAGRAAFAGGAMALRGARQALGRYAPTLSRFLPGAAKGATEVTGREMPETVSQALGSETTLGNLAQKMERYLGSSWVGRPLREVRQAQQGLSRDILATLSHGPTPSPKVLAQNWDAAREATRLLAEPIYQQLDDVALPQTAKAAERILKDYGDALSGRAKSTIQSLAGEGHEAEIRRLMSQGLPRERAIRELQRAGIEIAEPNGAAALESRHELGQLANRLTRTDPSVGREVWAAHDLLDKAINVGLSPAQQTMKAEADLLWRRSYIMDDVFDTMFKAQAKQAPGLIPEIDINAFTKLVNELAYAPARRIGKGGQRAVGRRLGKLDALFDNPADKQGMIDLADFLKQKTASGAGASGLSESIANIGTALMALSVPLGVASGVATGSSTTGAATSAGYLTALYGLSHILARGNGARQLLGYFRGPSASAAAALVRAVVEPVRAGAGRTWQHQPAATIPPLPPPSP